MKSYQTTFPSQRRKGWNIFFILAGIRSPVRNHITNEHCNESQGQGGIAAAATAPCLSSSGSLHESTSSLRSSNSGSPSGSRAPPPPPPKYVDARDCGNQLALFTLAVRKIYF